MKTIAEYIRNGSYKKFFIFLIGLFSILAVKSVFDNDSSKIISKKGRKILSDDDKMKEINRQFNEGKQEVFI